MTFNQPGNQTAAIQIYRWQGTAYLSGGVVGTHVLGTALCSTLIELERCRNIRVLTGEEQRHQLINETYRRQLLEEVWKNGSSNPQQSLFESV